MSQLESYALVGGERQDAIDHCLAGIARLSNEVTDATGFIPAYDQRTYAQVSGLIDSLLDTLTDLYRQSKLSQRSSKKLDQSSRLSQGFNSRPPTRMDLPYL
jgi:hypothetical protein